MKKIKVLSGVAVMAISLVGAVSCNKDTKTILDPETVVNAAISSSAILVSNTSSPIRDTTYGIKNSLNSGKGGYVVAATQYRYVSDDGVSADVEISWDYNSTDFTVKEDASAHTLTLKPVYPEYGKTTSVSLKGTAKYEGKEASLTFELSLTNDKNLVAISKMVSGESVAVRGYVTGIFGKGSSSTYGVVVQAGNDAFMIYNAATSKVKSLKIGDCVEVLGTVSVYNSQRQITGSTASVEILSGDEASSVTPVSESATNVSLKEFNSSNYLSLRTLKGLKILEVEDVTNLYNGTSTEHAYIQAKALYQGEEVWLFSDRYNTDYEDKVSWYNMLKEAKDSDGKKTINFTGAIALGKKLTASTDPNKNASESTLSDQPSLMFIGGLDQYCEVSNEEYKEVIKLNISGDSSVFIDEEITLKASASGKEAEVSWSSSDTSVATVSETGVVKGIKEGEVTITATLKSDSSVVATKVVKVMERTAEPEYVKASVSEVLEKENNKKTAYVVRGKVKNFCDNKQNVTETLGAYGNLILEDETDSSKSIFVYGISGKASALSYDASTKSYSFNNAKDATTNEDLKNLKVGDIVTMVAIRADYKTTIELTGVLSSVNDTVAASQEATLKEVTSIGGPATNNLVGQHVYHSSATIKTIKNTTYGNLVVSDDEGNEYTVYGATSDSDAFVFNGSKKPCAYAMSNKTTWSENEATKDLKVGDKIEFDCIRADYKGNVQISLQNVKKAA